MAELFATTGNSVALIRKRDDTWNVTLTLKDSGAQCLALDQDQPGTLYIGTQGRGVWKSIDEGQTWRDMKLPQHETHITLVIGVNMWCNRTWFWEKRHQE